MALCPDPTAVTGMILRLRNIFFLNIYNWNVGNASDTIWRNFSGITHSWRSLIQVRHLTPKEMRCTKVEEENVVGDSFGAPKKLKRNINLAALCQ